MLFVCAPASSSCTACGTVAQCDMRFLVCSMAAVVRSIAAVYVWLEYGAGTG